MAYKTRYMANTGKTFKKFEAGPEDQNLKAVFITECRIFNTIRPKMTIR